MRERWELYTKKADFEKLAEEFHILPVTTRLLVNRGIDTPEKIREYFYGSIQDLADPYRMKDMDIAVGILQDVILSGERIAIVSDFDVDGIFSGEILYEGIENLGGHAKIYTPSRKTEGYGLNRRIIDEAYRDGFTVILTCDNGIAAMEEVRYAKSLGFLVIITDHHEVQYEELDGDKIYHVPEADAVVDPKQQDCGYLFKGLCGTGVAFRLMEALYERMKKPHSLLEPFYEYVAIATVADIMELQSENRILVKEGLKRLRDTEHVGLSALMEEMSLTREKVNAYALGFVIGPSFNSIGRIGDISLAFDFLQNQDQVTAIELAKEIHELNEERKRLTEEGYREAIETIEKSDWKNDKVYLVPLKDADESIVGIIAGRLKERFSKPVFVFAEASGEGNNSPILKGSGRSTDAYSMMDELLKAKEYMVKFGGHKMAAGLSITEENLPLLRKALNEQCTLEEKDFVPKVSIDVPVPMNYLSEELISEINLLEPTGTGNPKPLFARQHFKIHKLRIVGQNQNVVLMEVSDESRVHHSALYFGDAEKFLSFLREEYGEGELEKAKRSQENNIDIGFTYEPNLNEFMGRKEIQIFVKNYCRIS